MRGARLQALQPQMMEGIIPADAGSTMDYAGVIVEDRDHPRGCGEHLPDSIDERFMEGSSPRMRGALVPKL